jgi:hypothetical protein
MQVTAAGEGATTESSLNPVSSYFNLRITAELGSGCSVQPAIT